MQFINDKGRFLGLLNILDLAVLLFAVLVIITLYIYAYSPPRILEHEEVLLQMYFPDVPYAVGQQVFIPGNEFVATYRKGDRMTIIDADYTYYGVNCLSNDASFKALYCKYDSFQQAFQDIPSRPEYEADYFVTINASLEIDAEGDLLYNGFNMGQGNIVYLQLNNSYLRGVVWRMNYNHSVATKNVTIFLPPEDDNLSAVGAIIYSFKGDEIGKVISIKKDEQRWYVTLEMKVDVYDEEYFLDEQKLDILRMITFFASDATYTGQITEID